MQLVWSAEMKKEITAYSSDVIDFSTNDGHKVQ